MKEIARIAQKSEHEYIGVACGIMDQLASALGKKDHLLFLDCKTLDFRHILFTPGGVYSDDRRFE